MMNIETRMSVKVALLRPLTAFTRDSRKQRRVGAKGIICAWFGAERRKVWLRYPNGKVVAYLADELEPVRKANIGSRRF